MDLHACLSVADVGSSVVVGRKKSGTKGVTDVRYLLPFEQRTCAIAENLLSLQGLLYPSTLLLHRRAPIRDCDVVHLHNIHGEYLNASALALLSKAKPTLWTLHDQWALTGKCVYPQECSAWQRECGNCPILDIPPRLRRDNTRLLLRYKKLVYDRSNLCIVCPSLWLQEQTKRSQLKDCRIEHIPNGIDTGVFHPRAGTGHGALSKSRSKAIFVSSDVHSQYKGFAHLQAVLPELSDSIHLSVLGRNDRQPLFVDQRIGRELGFVSTRVELASHLAEADFTVMPSIAENHSLTALESMACGTPVVAFKSGGLAEQVIDGESGLLVPPGDQRALLEAIRYLATNPERRAEMGRNAAARIASGFTREKMAMNYRALYESEIERRRKSSATA